MINLAVLIIVAVILVAQGVLGWMLWQHDKGLRERLDARIESLSEELDATDEINRQLSNELFDSVKALMLDKTQLLITTQGDLTNSLRETIVEVGKVVIGHSDTVKAHSQALMDSAHTEHVSPRRTVSR